MTLKERAKLLTRSKRRPDKVRLERLAFVEQAILSDVSECIYWPYRRNSHGYAIMYFDKYSRWEVHRKVCEIYHGDRPTKKHQVAHSCGQGRGGCINPKHLRWATFAENIADKKVHGTDNVGERNGMAKISDDTVRSIRALKGLLKHREIAAKFGISTCHVTQILNRKSRTDI